jgi:hypothetical protein
MTEWTKERIENDNAMIDKYIDHRVFNNEMKAALTEIEKLQRERPIPCGDVLDVTAIMKSNASLRELVGDAAILFEKVNIVFDAVHVDCEESAFDLEQASSDIGDFLSRAKECLK